MIIQVIIINFRNMGTKLIGNILWLSGCHTPYLSSIYKTIESSINLGMTATQFFLRSPRSIKEIIIPESDIEASKTLCAKFPISVFSHFPYVVNFAGSVDQLAWSGDDSLDAKLMYKLGQLQYELEIIANFGNTGGVVIHPGFHKDRKNGIKTIAASINKIKFAPDSRLLLENSAGNGNSLASIFEEIKEIYDLIDIDKQKHIGVCLDTAHIHGNGLYDLSKVDEVNKMFNDFDKVMGIDKLFLVHLNDSKVMLGSKKDRHEFLGKGQIWGEYLDGLFSLLKFCNGNKVPVILETGMKDMYTLAILSKMSTNDLIN